MNFTFESYLATPLIFEKELLGYFDQRSKMTIFDIGACEGEDSIKYARMFPNARVYAFEPLPSNFDKMEANIKKYNCPNISVEPLALSNVVGISNFFVSSGKPDKFKDNDDWDFGNKSSSLLQPDKVKEYHKWLSFNNEIAVKTGTINDYCVLNGIASIDFIHMDVQGAELLVLEGAQGILDKVKMIWLEVEAVSLYRNQPLKKDIEAFMQHHKFQKIYDGVDDIAGDQLYVHSAFHNDKFRKPFIDQLRNGIKNQLLKISTVKKILHWKHLAFLYEEAQNAPKYHHQSFSQCGEDLIVKHIFDNMGILKPSYIDVGAHHPYYLSNTALFYTTGSRGINIEPDPILFAEFLTQRKEDVNLNIGVGDVEEVVDFYVIASPTLNTFSKEEADKYSNEGAFPITRIEKIAVRTLKNILNDFAKGVFPQFLSIDAEGVDELIIKNIDYERNYPIVICVETVSFSTIGRGVKNTQLIDYLNSHGYLTYADTNINTIFVRKEYWEREK